MNFKRLHYKKMSVDMDEDGDYVCTPRGVKTKDDEKDDEWYFTMWGEEPYRPRPTTVMNLKKKRELEDYNFRRKEFEEKQKSFATAKQVVEDKLPMDISNAILEKAGFYLPKVLRF